MSFTFREYWILADRIDFANDNGEHLFRYLQRERRDIRCKYVLSRGAPQWPSLRAEFGRDVVSFGSPFWLISYLRSQVVITSHLKDRIFPRRRISKLIPGAPKLVYLGHGVQRGDKSLILSKFPIDMFIASTASEAEAVASASMSHVAHPPQVVIAGLARWDRLRELSDASTPQGDAILIAPTWRNGSWMKIPLVSGRHRLDLEQIVETEWFMSWSNFWNSKQLLELAQFFKRKIVVLVHPAFSDLLALEDPELGQDVEFVSFYDSDVQTLLASGSVLITDYSSIAWDAALLEIPIIYFHFESHVSNGGSKPGYFKYHEHGFGPISSTPKQLISELNSVATNGFRMTPEYQSKTRATFPLHNRLHREIIVAQIESLVQNGAE